MKASRPKTKHSPWAIAFTVTLATFMEVLDTSIANVSLPHIAGNLSASLDEATWILTSYLVANAIVLPLSAWFSSIIGRKNYYMLSVALFTVSSLLSGLAPSLAWLVFFRVLQGIGGGGLQPSEQSILADTFPPEKLGMAMAMYGVAVVTAPILGPTLGGWLTDNVSWRWIFFINIPVGALSLFMTSRVVEDPPSFKRRAFKAGQIDAIGLGAIALGIASLQIILDKGQRDDWLSSPFIFTLAIISLVSLSFAVVWELNQKDPIVDIGLLRDGAFAITNGCMFVLGVVLFGSTVMLPVMLQSLFGYTATLSGLVLSPGGFITMATMPLVGFLLGKTQPKYLIAIGLLVVGSSLYSMSHFSLQIDYRTALIARMIQAGGLGFLFIPINTAAYAYVPPEKHTQASGLINLFRNIGGSVGIAYTTTMMTRYSQQHQDYLSAHLSATSSAFQNSLKAATQHLATGGVAPLRAHELANGTFYAQLQKQAGMLAYVDDFKLISYICFAALLLVIMMRKTPPKKSPAPA